MTTTVDAPARGRRGSASPVVATPVKPVANKRRPGMIALAIALIALGGGTGAWLLTRGAETQEVLTITSAVSRGEAIEATDLTLTELPVSTVNLSLVPSSQLEDVVGQVAAVDLLPGVLLSPESTTTALTPAAGQSVVGVALTDMQRPARALGAGDPVRFVATPQAGGEMPLESPATIDATVINTQGGANGGVILNVELPADQAPQLAALAATNRIALVIDPVE